MLKRPSFVLEKRYNCFQALKTTKNSNSFIIFGNRMQRLQNFENILEETFYQSMLTQLFDLSLANQNKQKVSKLSSSKLSEFSVEFKGVREFFVLEAITCQIWKSSAQNQRICQKISGKRRHVCLCYLTPKSLSAEDSRHSLENEEFFCHSDFT